MAREERKPTLARSVAVGQYRGEHRCRVRLGVALANFVHGVPLDSGGDFAGDFWDLFSPYTVFVGLIVVLLFAFHGATYLTLRTTDDLRERAVETARRLAIPAMVGGIAALAWTVAVAIDNNERELLGPLIPAALGAAVLLLAALFAIRRREGWAFAMTALATILLVATIFTGLYPRVLVSSPEFANSLTVSNASASEYSLTVMTVVAAVFLPVVVLYQAWAYRVFRARIGGRRPQGPVDALSTRSTEPPRSD